MVDSLFISNSDLAMKKFCVYFVAVIVVLVLTDFLFGFIANIQKKVGLKGDYQPIEYVMKECNEEALILGSSVVLNCLKPSIIEDSLNVSCYNAGANSQTVIYYHTILNMVLKRYNPKIVFLGIRATEFQDENLLRYNILVPYYRSGYAEIDSVLESESGKEKFLLNSNLYRYNTIWFRILLYNFIKEHDKKDKGFLIHEKPAAPPVFSVTSPKRYVSSHKLEVLKSIIDMCKSRGIKLVMFSPPNYCKLTETPMTLTSIEQMCNENDIPFYNDTQLQYFIDHVDLFYDSVHLNKYGADIYTKLFISRAKSQLK